MSRRGRTLHIALLLAVACSAIAFPARAGKFNRVLSVGDPAPVWKDLIGVDDKRHGLADCKKKLVVLVFIANHCPVAAAYEGRLKQLAADYRERDVELVAISISQLEPDRLDKMKERAKDSQFPFLYLQDTSQAMGHRFGTTVTPQVFILNSDRRIAYMGAFDDQWKDAAKVETHYTRAAIEALLAGKQPEIRETRPVGCAIEYADDPQQNKP
ncbi:MAG: thioredoxin family protein [Planctomycetota bacterium]